MDPAPPRLRVFAGPNGSGKTTIKSVVPDALLGDYINPDDLASAMISADGLSLETFGLAVNDVDLRAFFASSEFLRATGTTRLAENLRVVGDALHYPRDQEVGYVASALSDYLRRRLMVLRRSFSFETVMSSYDKVALLRDARASGYRVYLYYVATEDPRINASRVAARVRLGGHPVPEEKIRNRYFRSLEHLADAIHYANRAYLFDNSGDENALLWIAEITEGRALELRTRNVPAWVETYVIRRMVPTEP